MVDHEVEMVDMKSNDFLDQLRKEMKGDDLFRDLKADLKDLKDDTIDEDEDKNEEEEGQVTLLENRCLNETQSQSSPPQQQQQQPRRQRARQQQQPVASETAAETQERDDSGVMVRMLLKFVVLCLGLVKLFLIANR
mmetsp:Transcript_41676/g.58143  ORF Transcript_41676/g.58143 Transcript_41676/m.58143 type:complete len:137 (-) Transcript_41676:52-462(-)